MTELKRTMQCIFTICLPPAYLQFVIQCSARWSNAYACPNSKHWK